MEAVIRLAEMAHKVSFALSDLRKEGNLSSSDPSIVVM